MVAKLISSYKTASRCWIPINQTVKGNIARSFSSKQRFVNFNNINSHNLVANDDVLSSSTLSNGANTAANASNEEYNFETFEPTIHSSEEIHTAGPIKRHE